MGYYALQHRGPKNRGAPIISTNYFLIDGGCGGGWEREKEFACFIEDYLPNTTNLPTWHVDACVHLELPSLSGYHLPVNYK